MLFSVLRFSVLICCFAANASAMRTLHQCSVNASSPVAGGVAVASASSPKPKKFTLHLLFTRHGISIANILDVVIDQLSGMRPTYFVLDAPLADGAKDIAQSAGAEVIEYIKGLRTGVFKAAVVSSVLTRAQQTAYYQFSDPWASNPSIIPLTEKTIHLAPFIREEGSSVTLNNMPYDYLKLSSEVGDPEMKTSFGDENDPGYLWKIKTLLTDRMEDMQALRKWHWNAEALGVRINRELLAIGQVGGLWGPQNIAKFIDSVVFKRGDSAPTQGLLQKLLNEVEDVEDIDNKHMVVAVVTHSNLMAQGGFPCEHLWAPGKPVNSQVADLQYDIEVVPGSYDVVDIKEKPCVNVMPPESLRREVVTEIEKMEPEKFIKHIGTEGFNTIDAVLDASSRSDWHPKESALVRQEVWKEIEKIAKLVEIAELADKAVA